MASRIHPSAVVSPKAQLGEGVEIGPFCVVDEHVTIGEGTQLLSHVAISGHTKLGAGNRIFPFASLGHAPQDLKFKGEASTLEIGDHNVIREHVTMNPGTAGGGGRTVVGSHCLFMVGTHVAHDCQVGDHVIMANNATLAGHVVVGDHSVLGGLSAVHQFVRIGAHAMIGGLAGVEQDVIPFGSVVGERAGLAGLNLVGLKRRGYEREQIHALRNAFKHLFEEGSDGVLAQRCDTVLAKYPDIREVREMVDFIRHESHRSILTPRHG